VYLMSVLMMNGAAAVVSDDDDDDELGVYTLGIPVYSEHAIAAYFAYFAKMRISHVFPHIMAFSGFQYSL